MLEAEHMAQPRRNRILIAWLHALLGMAGPVEAETGILKPAVITEAVAHDSDDPAIWVDPADSLKSLILGTDKDVDGSIYAFDLDGKIVNRVAGLIRPNNIDIVTGFQLGGKTLDLAVVTERGRQKLRVFRLPDLTPVDGGGLVVFQGDVARAPMGIALYQRPTDHAVFAVVSGKTGPADGYLWQYRLEDNGSGEIRMVHIRSFGKFSGAEEIESIAVDSARGSVYYSDESFGVREYAADPEAKDAAIERSVTGTGGFTKDREGISIYPTGERTGFLLVSDQGADRFRIFRREHPPEETGGHEFVASIQVAATDSDGSDVTARPMGPRFPKGMLVAMSSDRTFHYYDWREIEGRLGKEPNRGK